MSEFDELMSKKAVALKYDPDRNGAPVVVASGMGYMAERITEAALDAGVPVYEDDSLATLLTQLKLVVEIYVYFLGFVPDQRSGEQEEPEDGEETELSAGE